MCGTVLLPSELVNPLFLVLETYFLILLIITLQSGLMEFQILYDQAYSWLYGL